MRQRARRQFFTVEEAQRQWQHLMAVAVHVIRNRPRHLAAAVIGVDLFLLADIAVNIRIEPWLTMMQSLYLRFISIARSA
jgi:hypothetical protein